MTPQTLIIFEQDIAARFDRGEVNGPVHLSSGNEKELIEIFQNIKTDDWKFSTWRAHYHALLSGVPSLRLRNDIINGKSLNLKYPEYNFFTSAIVGGCLPIAVGVAEGIKRSGGTNHVWCFIGDMTASIGTFHDALNYSEGHDLSITFVIEDNGYSVNTPTHAAWGKHVSIPRSDKWIIYRYLNKYPHWATTKGKSF